MCVCLHVLIHLPAMYVRVFFPFTSFISALILEFALLSLCSTTIISTSTDCSLFSHLTLIIDWQCSFGESCPEGTHQDSPEAVGERS